MFSFGNKKNRAPKIVALDCLNSAISEYSDFPVEVDENGDFESGKPAAMSFEAEGGPMPEAVPAESAPARPVLNSAPLAAPASLQAVNTLQIGKRIFLIFAGDGAMEQAKKVDLSKWLIFNTDSGIVEDEAPFDRIRAAVERRGLTGNGLAICPRGVSTGFFFTQIFGGDEDAQPSIGVSEGEIICPLCWLKFDIGDAMSIASHESLRGDTVLGSEEMMRFLPTAFDSEGVALDPAGMPAPDVACPHCRKRLPTGYLDLNRHIFSIVGAPSAGKSYYLSVLIKELQTALFKHFGASFKDLDPSGNMLLTQMKNRLFSAERPEEAILAKTALEGAMYERYPRFGKMVALPKPMTYAVSKEGKNGSPGVASALIFYDNAGEHFEPGLDMDDSPGAMHVASSDAIFFLFDPAANRNFKRMLPDNPDPQLKIGGRLDQQDTILAEMEVRIKRILGLSSRDRVQTPLAVMLGKSDLWLGLLNEPLAPYYLPDGSFSKEAVDGNSEILRRFMLDADPSIVSGAESISENVKYFAISSLGHSPVKLEDGPQAGKIAPVPSKLAPSDVEIPTLWTLSILEPGLSEG